VRVAARRKRQGIWSEKCRSIVTVCFVCVLFQIIVCFECRTRTVQGLLHSIYSHAALLEYVCHHVCASVCVYCSARPPTSLRFRQSLRVLIACCFQCYTHSVALRRCILSVALVCETQTARSLIICHLFVHLAWSSQC
jgi:hypothetical protein